MAKAARRWRIRRVVAVLGAVATGSTMSAVAGAAHPAALERSPIEGSAIAAVELTPVQTFTFTGASQSVAVPSRATSVQITAVGGSGGAAGLAFTAGAGDKVRGVVPLATGLSQLQVNVGGNGTKGGSSSGAGGWNGGGNGGIGGAGGNGAGGGGASDVRTSADPVDRIFVAAGGGGAGGARSPALPGTGGAGGAAGFGGTAGTAANSGAGGAAGVGNAGGAGGAAAGTPAGSGAGAQGSVTDGGTGGASSSSGGGGAGGGRYGGGGGGAGQVGGGGGGGLSFSKGTSESFFTTDATPRVVIQFELAPLDILTCTPQTFTVGQDIGIANGCTTKGQPVPAVSFDASSLPPGVGGGVTQGSSGDRSIMYLYGSPTKAGHWSAQVTATLGADAQVVVLEIQVDPPLLGAEPTTTTTPGAVAPAATTAQPVSATPAFAG